MSNETLFLRKPDFYVNLWTYKIPGWQLENQYTIKLELQDGNNLIISNIGMYNSKDTMRMQELFFTILNGLMKKYSK